MVEGISTSTASSSMGESEGHGRTEPRRVMEGRITKTGTTIDVIVEQLDDVVYVCEDYPGGCFMIKDPRY
jgi:hypothetical protein